MAATYDEDGNLIEDNTLGGPGPHWSTIGPTAGSTPGTPGFDGTATYPTVEYVGPGPAVGGTVYGGGGNPPTESGYAPSSYPYSGTAFNPSGSSIEGYDAAASGYYDASGAVGPDGYSIDAPAVDVTNRDVGRNEMAGYQLEGLLDPNSALSKRAIQSGKDWAAGRGLMNSSIAGGASYGAWVDRATPLALDQAGVYQRTAGENMAATNVGSLEDARNRLTANLAETGYDAARDAAQREFLYGASTDMRRAALNVENREDLQKFNTSERLAIQAFQRGERIDTQDWTDAQRMAVQEWQTGERLGTQDFTSGERVDSQAWATGERLGTEAFNMGLARIDEAIRYAGISQQDRTAYLQAWSMVEMGQFNSIGQAGAAIYSNTELTAAQQQQAIQNMINFFSGIAPSIPSSYGPGTAPPLTTTPPATSPYIPPSSTGPVTSPISPPLVSYVPPTGSYTASTPPGSGIDEPVYEFGLM